MKEIVIVVALFVLDCLTHWRTAWPWKTNSNTHCCQKGRAYFVISHLQAWHISLASKATQSAVEAPYATLMSSIFPLTSATASQFRPNLCLPPHRNFFWSTPTLFASFKFGFCIQIRMPSTAPSRRYWIQPNLLFRNQWRFFPALLLMKDKLFETVGNYLLPQQYATHYP